MCAKYLLANVLGCEDELCTAEEDHKLGKE